MPLKQEEIPQQHEAVKTTSVLPESFKPTEELPEPPQPHQSIKGELHTECEFALTGCIKKDYLPPEEQSDVQPHTVTSSKAVEDATEQKPLNGTQKIEALAHETQEPPKPTELFDLEKTVTLELLEKKVVEVTADESFKVLPEDTSVTEAVQDPGQVLPNSR